MNIKIDNYVFDKTAGTITFSDYTSITIERVVMVINVTDNVIIYNFAGSGKGGTVSGNVLTLAYDTSTMSDTDNLQIIYDDNQASSLIETMVNLKQMFRSMVHPAWVDRGSNRVRETAIIESGTVTTVTTVTTCGTLTNIDGYQGKQLIIDSNRNSWYNGQRRTIS
jgi:hypothetical protein